MSVKGKASVAWLCESVYMWMIMMLFGAELDTNSCWLFCCHVGFFLFLFINSYF